MKRHAIIILAAGSSSRFGYPKQLVKHNSISLIRHALAEASKSSEQVLVVLGANFELIKNEIGDYPASLLVNNPDWEEGMSSSIRCGLSELLKKDPLIDAVIFMVCDQPFADASLLAGLVAKYKEGNKAIIASAYKDTIGTPVLFDKAYFPVLLELKGQSGAKKIITENIDAVAPVPFPLGYVDIDTKEDYKNLKKKFPKN
jgi:molybdenum cofactor cytidylyltransferase